MATPSASTGDRIRFGHFEVDVRNLGLWKHGARLRVQEQPFKVLTALLERPGKLVTREELRKRIWGEGTFVEFDHGLNAAVNRLREVLRDSAEQPRYLETVARRGYRFIAAVESNEQQRPAAKVSRRWVWFAAAAIISAAATAGLWWNTQRTESWPMRLSPLTSLPGGELMPSFSPDGKQVAFVWRQEKQADYDLYVNIVGSTGAPMRLTSDQLPVLDPVWSPTVSG